MLNSYFSKINFILLIALVFSIKNLSAQCNPTITTIPALDCNEAKAAVSGNGNGFLCNLDGYCVSSIDAPQIPNPIPFCTNNSVINNPIWYSFRADNSGLLNVDVTPTMCTSGIQWALYDQCGNYFDAIACQSFPVIPPSEIFNISATIVPGNIYYLMIDGANGGQCSFEFHATSGIDNPPIGDLLDPELNTNTAVCPGQDKSYSFGGYEYASRYQWTFNGKEVGSSINSSIDFNIPADTPEGISTLCVTALSDCNTETKQTCWDVEVSDSLTVDLLFKVCEGDSLLYQNNYYQVGEHDVIDKNPNDCVEFIHLTVEEYVVNTNDTVKVSVCPGVATFNYDGIIYDVNKLYTNVSFENESRCNYSANLIVSNIDDSELLITSTLDTIACSDPVNAILALEGNINSSNELISQAYLWKKYLGPGGNERTLSTNAPGEYILEVTSTFKTPDVLADVMPNTVCTKILKYVIVDSDNIFNAPVIEIESQQQDGKYILSALPVISWADYIWTVPEGVTYSESNYGKINLEFPNAGLYEICVYMVDMCSVSEQTCIEINVPTLKTSGNKYSGLINLIQNPVDDLLKFNMKDFPSKEMQILIYNLNGTLVKSGILNAIHDVSTIDIGELNRGIFIYRMLDNKGNVKSGKFVKM